MLAGNGKCLQNTLHQALALIPAVGKAVTEDDAVGQNGHGGAAQQQTKI